MKKVAVIGAGASGLIASIYASINNEVTIIERNNKCGKKILMTGNGKCNYWNEFQSLTKYHSQNKELLEPIITPENQQEILNFFDNLGIIPKIKNGWYYPYSNQAISINYALNLENSLSNVTILNNTVVTNISKINDTFEIATSNGLIKADKVILATGSKAMPQTGSDGSGYTLAKSLGHTIINPLPALVSLKGNQKYLKKWAGIRTDVKISLNDIVELGEIQLTDYGISGICVFNLSYKVNQLLQHQKSVKLCIDFLPWLELDNFYNFIEKRNSKLKKRNISELFDGMLNYKLVNVLLELSNINSNDNWNKLTDNQKKSLMKNLRNFTFEVTDSNSFDKAQICSGGIPLKEINPKTMESLKTEGLYIVGELLDVNGDCGGYNLSFAWLSGMIAGKNL